jgi:hypothetical protein
MFMDWEINMVKMSILTKAIYRLSAIIMKILLFYIEIMKTILQYIWKYKKKTKIAKQTLSKRKTNNYA